MEDLEQDKNNIENNEIGQSSAISLEKEVTKEDLLDYAEQEKNAFLSESAVELGSLNSVNLDNDDFEQLKGETNIDAELNKINKEAEQTVEEIKKRANNETSLTDTGVNFVFEQQPELEKIGTKEQYSNYVEQIFPGSKFKEVVYHGSPVNTIEKFNEERRDGHVGIYFSRSLGGAKNYARSWDGTEKVYPVVLDVNNFKTLNGKEYTAEEYNKIQMVKEKPTDVNAIFYDNNGGINDEIAVFNSSQVHILGNEQDIQSFRTWVESSKTNK
jgi:hypothetical protein